MSTSWKYTTFDGATIHHRGEAGSTLCGKPTSNLWALVDESVFALTCAECKTAGALNAVDAAWYAPVVRVTYPRTEGAAGAAALGEAFEAIAEAPCPSCGPSRGTTLRAEERVCWRCGFRR